MFNEADRPRAPAYTENIETALHLIQFSYLRYACSADY